MPVTRRIAGIALVAGLAAACASAAGPSKAQTNPSAAADHRSRHADAILEAKRLIKRRPTTADETAAAAAPRKILRSGPMRPFGHTVVTQERFWMSARSPKAVFNALTHSPPRGMQVAGSGSEGDRGHVVERDAEFSAKHVSTTLASADLQIEVVPVGHGNSAVGVYAEVVPQPIRHRNEDVPRALRTATVARIDDSDNSVIKRRTVTGSAALVLVRDFDALRREPPEGESSCALQFTSNRATFVAHGHTWRVDDEFCGVDSVTRDGHRLPDLVPSKEFSADLSADLR
jgi:hypothetical protein